MHFIIFHLVFHDTIIHFLVTLDMSAFFSPRIMGLCLNNLVRDCLMTFCHSYTSLLSTLYINKVF
jgi:hypothetical protein